MLVNTEVSFLFVDISYDFSQEPHVGRDLFPPNPLDRVSARPSMTLERANESTELLNRVVEHKLCTNASSLIPRKCMHFYCTHES